MTDPVRSPRDLPATGYRRECSGIRLFVRFVPGVVEGYDPLKCLVRSDVLVATSISDPPSIRSLPVVPPPRIAPPNLRSGCHYGQDNLRGSRTLYQLSTSFLYLYAHFTRRKVGLALG